MPKPGSFAKTQVMLKCSALFTVLAFFCCTTITLHAQTTTNTTVLARASQAFGIAQKNNYDSALLQAREKGWPLTFTGPNNQQARLIGVDPFGFPKYYVTYNNTTAAATTRASQLWPGGSTGLNLSGSSANMKNKIGEWDGGSPRSTHVELTGRITIKDGATAVSHSTHVAGTLIATGVNPVAKGMAFGAQGLISYDYTNDVSEMFGEANNLLLSNHSYGILAGWNQNTDQGNRWEYYGRPGSTEDYKFGYYSEDAQSLDSLAYNAPFYLVVKAAGNNRVETGPAVGQTYWGYSTASPNTLVNLGPRPTGISSNDSYGIISWDANAKNILTVGAVAGLPSGYTNAAGVTMSTFSSWGPTDDGRIKPDIVADGVSVTSCTSTSNTSYATMSGTSMATPNATGSLFLLQEYYSQLKSGSFMRSATLKGLAIHTADEAGADPGPDYRFGWGLLDVEKAAAVITAAVPSNNAATSNHLLYENVLNNGSTYTLPVVASGQGPLVVTISWTDVKGTVDLVNTLNNSAKKLVNDLDVRVSDGTTTTLPWVLNPAVPASAATKGDNITDNVERINIDNPVAGTSYAITVKHKGTLARGQQAYSLMVSGVGGTAPCVTGPVIAQVGDSLVSTTALFYQWYQDNIAISGATTHSYKPVATGVYKVITSNGLGCSLSSNTLTIGAGADANGSLTGIKVTPNPSNGTFELSFIVPILGDLKIEVVNMLGQPVYTKKYPDYLGSFGKQLNIGHPAAGIYIMRIQYRDSWYLRKLMIK